jgi:hypothetical protein
MDIHNHKKCKLIKIKILSNEMNRHKKGLEHDKGKMPCKYCTIHKKIVCRCGWEFGWHGGTNNKLLK